MAIQLIAEKLDASKVCLRGGVTCGWFTMPPGEWRGQPTNVGQKQKQKSDVKSFVEKTNGAKLSRLLIDGGTTVLRNVFDSHHPPANLAANLNVQYRTLHSLFRRRILNKSQWDKLFPPSADQR